MEQNCPEISVLIQPQTAKHARFSVECRLGTSATRNHIIDPHLSGPARLLPREWRGNEDNGPKENPARRPHVNVPVQLGRDEVRTTVSIN